MKRTHVFAFILACIVFVPLVTATTSISGTVTVTNGTADGANVTITPMTQQFQMANDPVRTTVTGNSFTADVPDAPVYHVEVVEGGATHYAVLQNTTTVSMHLSHRLSGQVVNQVGEPQSNATIELLDSNGMSVDRAKTGANGAFAFEPLQPNRSYRVHATVNGVPYRKTVTTSEKNSSLTISTPPPTNDSSVLNVLGGNPASHVIQVLATQNKSNSFGVVETLTLKNNATKPYVGNVTVAIPPGGTPYSAMAQGQQAQFENTSDGVSINVSIPANSTAQIGVAYDYHGQKYEKRFGHDIDSVAVVLQGYDPTAVNHSDNLRVGEAPVPLLTNTNAIHTNDTIRLDLSNSRSVTGTGSSKSLGQNNSIPTFPTTAVFGGLGAIVFGGLVAYRIL